ncbi:glyoxalase [Micromonospora phytophila]|uniref:VOC family protein n=1 Tax=Micromonospora phytophila TaxID=709888 RepID=UPI00202F5460|nr:VOC family protein [Micromonospora phytophila]MCM0678153.1 glyoxalase [Micromonospora phytophila]
MKLEFIVLPIADVGRAKNFYQTLGWREDIDKGEGDARVVQMTPPRSDCSIMLGPSLTSAAPGSAQGLCLVVNDIEAARAELVGRGVEVSEVFHQAAGGLPLANAQGRAPGLAPDRGSYFSFASFNDPDGNGWLLQEVTTRFPGRLW